MKLRTLVGGAGFSVLVGTLGLVAACSNNNNPSTPTATPSVAPRVSPLPSGSPQPGGSWSQVNESTSCEAMNPQFCVGAYGFSVMSDGTYQVGPAPDGQTLTGSLTSGELDQLNSMASAVSSDDLSGNQTCQGPTGIPGMRDDMDFTRSPGSQTILVYQGFTAQGTNCTRGNPADVDALHSDMNGLMQKYYPRPFPTPAPSVSPSASPSP